MTATEHDTGSVTRRGFLSRTAAASAGLAVSGAVVVEVPEASADPPGDNLIDVTLSLNR